MTSQCFRVGMAVPKSGKPGFNQKSQRQEFRKHRETKLDRRIARNIERVNDRYFKTGGAVISQDQQSESGQGPGGFPKIASKRCGRNDESKREQRQISAGQKRECHPNQPALLDDWRRLAKERTPLDQFEAAWIPSQHFAI